MLSIKNIIFHVYECFVCMYMHHRHAEPLEARREHQAVRILECDHVVLGIERRQDNQVLSKPLVQTHQKILIMLRIIVMHQALTACQRHIISFQCPHGVPL